MKTIPGAPLLYGDSRSCGCLHDEMERARAGEASTRYRHGHSGRGHDKRLGPPTPEYRAWSQMRGRCNNPRHQGYHLYGAQGVEVCQRWNDFENFLADMGPKPTTMHVLGLHDPTGDYEPGNAAWMTRKQQMRNRRG